MKIIEENSQSVKDKLEKGIQYLLEQVSVQQKLADKFSNQKYRKELHTNSAEKFFQIVEDMRQCFFYMEELEKLTDQIDKGLLKKAPKNGIQLSLSFEEVSDLPEEVLKELSLSDSDKIDYQIRSLIEELGGIASLDRLIVGIYKETGEVLKRTTMTSKLYRMIQKGVVHSVPGKKGVYSLDDLTEEEADSLISGAV